MSSNNDGWEIIQMSNRRLQAQQRRFLRRRTTTTTPQQASYLQRYYRLLIMGAHRPSIMVPVLRRGTGSHRLNNNRIFAVSPQGRLSSSHGASQQASLRHLHHQFVIALTISRFLRRMSQNDPAAMSTYGRIRAACLPPPLTQNHPAPPPPSPPVNNAGVVNEMVRSQEPAPSEESATDDSEVNQPYINQPDNPMKNEVVDYEERDLTPKL